MLRGGDCKQLISGVYEDTAAPRGARAAPGGWGPAAYPDREGTEAAPLLLTLLLAWAASRHPTLNGGCRDFHPKGTSPKATTLDTCGVSYYFFS